MLNLIKRCDLRHCAVAACVAMLCTVHASGQVINPSFEDTPGFFGWNTFGATSIQTAAYDPGSPPTQGLQYALLTNDATSGAISTSALESSLGFTSGALTGLGDGTVVNGSAISQTFNATAGQVLTFDWDFLTNELDSTLNFSHDDFSFWSISGTPTILADVNTGTFITPEGSSQSQDYLDETGFAHASPISYTIPTTGSYTLAFGVVNVGVADTASGLLVDNIQLQGRVAPPNRTPEPGSLALLVSAGAGGLLCLKRRRIEARNMR